jgi:hypothetical protein
MPHDFAGKADTETHVLPNRKRTARSRCDHAPSFAFALLVGVVFFSMNYWGPLHTVVAMERFFSFAQHLPFPGAVPCFAFAPLCIIQVPRIRTASGI